MQRAFLALPFFLASAAAVSAASSPLGIWIDHTGRGAVEITECSGALCGRVVWLKDPRDGEGCNMQIIGNVKPVAGGKWDGGWIYDPDRQAKYDVELTPIGDQKLKVHGYAGMKLFGETMTWTRASADLERCSPPAAITAETARPAEAQPQHEAQPQKEARAEIETPTRIEPEKSAPRREADATIAEAPAVAPQSEAEPRSDTAQMRDALGALLKFSEGKDGSKGKTCTVRLLDFGKLTFPC